MSKVMFYSGICVIYTGGFLMSYAFTKNPLFVFLGGATIGTITNLIFGGFKYQEKKVKEDERRKI